jgi:hypothetical protein
LLLRIPEQSHPEMDWDEHEEDERNNHTNDHDRQEDDHQEDNFHEHNHWEDNIQEQENKGANFHMDQREDSEDLSRIVGDLERRCTYMGRDMEMRDKSKVTVVDKLLLGTDSPFTRRVANYRLPEKLKFPKILSYAGVGDLIENLNF